MPKGKEGPPAPSLSPDQAHCRDLGVEAEDTGDGGDLIQNLLGIQDSKMLDQILDSADSAARLLGVKYTLEGEK